MSSRVHYEEVQSRTALKNMAFRWSLNPYRGCVHGCHYCFARRFHLYYDLDPGSDFPNVIFAKVNLPEVLRMELSRPSWRRELVAIGTATDPYQPIEGKYQLTRHCLEALAERRTPVNLITKGTMAVRDVDVMGELARRAGCTVCFSLTTLDPDLAKLLEPGTPPPLKRLKAMERLVQAGVNAGVLVAPIVQGITDSVANLEAVVGAASGHGARWLGGNTLYLKPGTKEHFLGFLQDEYPALLLEYQRLYPGGFAPKRLQGKLHDRIGALARTHGIRGSSRQHQARQLQMTLG